MKAFVPARVFILLVLFVYTPHAFSCNELEALGIQLKDLSTPVVEFHPLEFASGEQSKVVNWLHVKTSHRELNLFNSALVAGGHRGMEFLVQEALGKMGEPGETILEYAGGEARIERPKRKGGKPLFIDINPTSGMLHERNADTPEAKLLEISKKFPFPVAKDAIKPFDEKNPHLIQLMNLYIHEAEKVLENKYRINLQYWKEKGEQGPAPVKEKANFAHEMKVVFKESDTANQMYILELLRQQNNPVKNNPKMEKILENLKPRASTHLAFFEALKAARYQFRTGEGKLEETDHLANVEPFFKSLLEGSKPDLSRLEPILYSYTRIMRELDLLSNLMEEKEGQYTEDQKHAIRARTAIYQVKK